MRKIPSIIIQALMKDGQWYTRNRLPELNMALLGGKITEQQAINTATHIMQSWSMNYKDGVQLRVFKDDQPTRKRRLPTRPMIKEEDLMMTVLAPVSSE